ncbi:MAG TPA: S53 family peptidase [Ktedonobacteraceae bacterium]|nr:S53 family peptidase [Ktedonobacteraceae bacterium]
MLVREKRSQHPLIKYVLVPCMLLLLLSACGGGNTTAQSTPTASSDASKLVNFDLGIPQKALQSPTTGNVPGDTKFHVLVTFKPNDPLLNSLGTQTTSSTNTTDGASLANQLGITDQQYQQIKQYFGVDGISLQLSKLHTTLALDAPASSFAKLLQTTFVYHKYEGRTFYAPATPIMLPQVVAERILSITGLDTYSKPPLKKSVKASSTQLQPLATDANDCATDPRTANAAQVRNIYGLNPLYAQGWQGQGTTIILPEFETFSEPDLQHYMSCVQFHGKVSVVTVNDNPPVGTPAGEALLDLEMVTGLLPAANIVVYQEDPASDYSRFWVAMDDVLAQIASDYSKITGPTQVSISWGGSEDFLSVGLVNAIDTQLRILQQVDHINVFVASGDCGAYDSVNYPDLLDVDFPSSDRSVVAVGGTNLQVSRQNTRASETVWSGDPKKPADCQNSWGSGGGLSQAFDQPTWQTGPGVQNKYSNGKRQVPDVSAVAWLVALYADGQWTGSGGTSAATPIWASVYDLVNQGLATKTQQFVVGGAGIFYWLAQKQAAQHPFFDVVQGNNLYYPATSGWDYATGFGAPYAVGLYNGMLEFIKSA